MASGGLGIPFWSQRPAALRAALGGTAKVLVVETGLHTAFGSIAARLGTREPETDFARGVRQFENLLVGVMIAIVLFVLTVNLLLGRPVIESLLFARCARGR